MVLFLFFPFLLCFSIFYLTIYLLTVCVVFIFFSISHSLFHVSHYIFIFVIYCLSIFFVNFSLVVSMLLVDSICFVHHLYMCYVTCSLHYWVVVVMVMAIIMDQNFCDKFRWNAIHKCTTSYDNQINTISIWLPMWRDHRTCRCCQRPWYCLIDDHEKKTTQITYLLNIYNDWNIN